MYVYFCRFYCSYYCLCRVLLGSISWQDERRPKIHDAPSREQAWTRALQHSVFPRSKLRYRGGKEIRDRSPATAKKMMHFESNKDVRVEPVHLLHLHARHTLGAGFSALDLLRAENRTVGVLQLTCTPIYSTFAITRHAFPESCTYYIFPSKYSERMSCDSRQCRIACI